MPFERTKRVHPCSLVVHEVRVKEACMHVSVHCQDSRHGQLMPHQLAGLRWLARLWVQGSSKKLRSFLKITARSEKGSQSYRLDFAPFNATTAAGYRCF